MTPDQKKEIKKQIIEKINGLTQRIDAFGQLSKPVAPDNAIGRLTRMEAINSKNMNEAALVKSKQTLKALKKALASIETPDFGICQHCEEPIARKRLAIMPQTSLCVDCAEKLGRGNR
jgi:DnaK suppressor protein